MRLTKEQEDTRKKLVDAYNKARTKDTKDKRYAKLMQFEDQFL